MSEQETIQNMMMEQIENECFIDLSETIELPPVAISFGEHQYTTKKGTFTAPTAIGTYGNFSFVQAPPKTMKTFLHIFINFCLCCHQQVSNKIWR